MKRVVYEKIGGLDERFGLGFFDDDDLAERARRAGFELAVAHDLFIHHFGSRTFCGNGVDAGTLLEENARRFSDKWGLKQANTKPVALRPWRGAGNGVPAPPGSALPPRSATPHTLTRSASEGVGEPVGELAAGDDRSSLTRSASEGVEESLLRGASEGVAGSPAESARSPAGGSAGPGLPTGSLAGASRWGDPRGDAASTGTLAGASGWGEGQPGARRADASVGLTMIVKNEEDHLAKCLESARGLFDEIIIVDTGSTDRTKAIAHEFGAKVFDFVWIDDFAAARNEALSHATCGYAFWLDADDVLEPAEHEKLRVLFAGLTRPSTGDTTSTMSAVTPPLTRPAGDLSPVRGDGERPGEWHSDCPEFLAAAWGSGDRGSGDTMGFRGHHIEFRAGGSGDTRVPGTPYRISGSGVRGHHIEFRVPGKQEH
jgi:Glycosyl transferase family 2